MKVAKDSYPTKATKILGSPQERFFLKLVLPSVEIDFVGFVEFAASTAVFENFPGFCELIWFGLSYFLSSLRICWFVNLGYPLLVSTFKLLTTGFFSGAVDVNPWILWCTFFL